MKAMNNARLEGKRQRAALTTARMAQQAVSRLGAIVSSFMAEPTSEKLKIFVSYSRRDSSEFADELVAGPELAGFAPFLDRYDIAAGEDWEARLGGRIQQADTVVFIISPEAVKSERCTWEVDTALAQSKQLLPVIFKPVPNSDIPEELRRRQFVRFDIRQE